MAIEDGYEAYCFDQAVGEWGSYVRNELDKIKGKSADAISGKRELMLKKLLESKTPEGRFATPVATATREEIEERA